MPPMSIQIALSVGDPVKNLETSELKEFVALMPTTMSTMPPTSKAREMILFIMSLQKVIDLHPGEIAWLSHTHHKALRPEMTLTSIMTMAITRRI